MKQPLINVCRPVVNLVDHIPKIQSEMRNFGIRKNYLWKTMLGKQLILGGTELSYFLNAIKVTPTASEIKGLATYLETHMSDSADSSIETPSLPFYEQPHGNESTTFSIGRSAVVQAERAEARMLTEQYFNVEDDGDHWAMMNQFSEVVIARTDTLKQTNNMRRMLEVSSFVLPEYVELDPVTIDELLPDVT